MAILTKNDRLHATILAVCPIIGVSIRTIGDPASVRIDFAAGATVPQQAAAQSALTSFDWSDAAQAAWEAAQQPERTAIQQQAAQAVTDINTYLAIASPTNAQVVTMLNKLCVDMRAVIKRLAQL